jgi:hypothetical protein
MPEAAQTLAIISALLLWGWIATWATLLRGPLLQRLDGSRTSNAGPLSLQRFGLRPQRGGGRPRNWRMDLRIRSPLKPTNQLSLHSKT